MALSNTVSADWIVEFQDRGAQDGSPTALSVVVITTIVKRINIRYMVGKDINVSGFGTADNFRAGKTNWEIDLEILVPVTSATAITIGDYAQIENTVGSNTETKYCGYVKSWELGVDDDSETIMRVTVKGPADGATTS